MGVGGEMRAPRSKSVHRKKGREYVCVDGLCVMIPEVPKRTYTRLHFVRKQHHFKDPTDDVDASKVGAVPLRGVHTT